MTTNRDLAIQKIEKEFERISNLVLEQLQLLGELFTTDQKERPGEILHLLGQNEEKIDRLEIHLDENIIKTIVLYKPVAVDLRRLFAVYHMTINLERVGDLVKVVSGSYMELQGTDMARDSQAALGQMLKSATRLVRKALLSFVNNDQDIASETILKKGAFEELNKKLQKKAIKSAGLSKKSQSIVMNLLDMRSMFTSLERIGDHATNIAESSIYAISGSDIRHMDPKNE